MRAMGRLASLIAPMLKGPFAWLAGVDETPKRFWRFGSPHHIGHGMPRQMPGQGT